MLATACCPRWLAPGSLRRGPGARGSTSPLTSRSPAPSVTHVSHTKPRWLREQAVGCAPREPGASGPHRAWPACRPCGRSPRAVRTGVVASGADAVLGRQAGERPSSMEERGVWAGEAAGRGQRCLSPPLLSLPSSVRVWPCLLIQAPNLGSRARCGRP